MARARAPAARLARRRRAPGGRGRAASPRRCPPGARRRASVTRPCLLLQDQLRPRRSGGRHAAGLVQGTRAGLPPFALSHVLDAATLARLRRARIAPRCTASRSHASALQSPLWDHVTCEGVPFWFWFGGRSRLARCGCAADPICMQPSVPVHLVFFRRLRSLRLPPPRGRGRAAGPGAGCPGPGRQGTSAFSDSRIEFSFSRQRTQFPDGPGLASPRAGWAPRRVPGRGRDAAPSAAFEVWAGPCFPF